MANWLQAISKAATPPAASSIGQLAATKKALKQPDPSPVPEGFVKAEPYPSLPPAGESPPAPKVKPLKTSHAPSISKKFLTDDEIGVLESAFEEGMLAKTPMGNYADPDLPEFALSSKKLKKKAQEFSEFFGVLNEPITSPPGGFQQKPYVDPWADIESMSDGELAHLTQLIYSDDSPSDLGGADTSPSLSKGQPDRLSRDRVRFLPKDLTRQSGENIRDYVARIKDFDTKYQAAARTNIEETLAKDVSEGRVGRLLPAGSGPSADIHNQATQDYLDYLAAHNVDQRTIDAVASGDLPMDLTSRQDRARDMGLDPDSQWHRWDYPFKKEFKGWTGAALSQRDFGRKQQGALKFIDLQPKSEGIVYTSHNPKYAAIGAQMPASDRVLYSLLGPDSGIAGIDELPPQAYDAFDSMQLKGLLKKYPGDSNASVRRSHQRNSHLAEPLAGDGGLSNEATRARSLKRLVAVGPETPLTAPRYETIPDFSTAENRKLYSEPLMASKAKGTLVTDETGISTAFTPSGAAQLRRADLAPMDPRFKDARNILQSLLAPIAVSGAVGAASDSGRK